MIHPRFDRKVILDRKNCIANMAYCISLLYPYDVYEGLAADLRWFTAVLDKTFEWESLGDFRFYAEFDLRESTRIWREIIDQCPGIVALNTPRSGHSENLFASRFDSVPAEHDFVDLDALAQNMTVRLAEREDAEAFLESA